MNLLLEGTITFEGDGAFYNPRMKLNRDIGVAMARSLGVSDYLDALSASGIRGLRMAKEGGIKKVVLNDISPRACELIARNAARNELEGLEVCNCDANVLMHSRHFEAVDLDPFGSPSPFLSAAASSARSYLFITATDTAPLCGAHLSSGIRKYMARPLNTDYHREMGARVLLGLAARELARVDKAMQPLLTHATQHYLRTYLRVCKGAALADRCLQEMGYLEHCFRCGSFHLLAEPRPEGRCRACNEATTLAGPLWLGKIQEQEVIGPALEQLQGNRPAEKLLDSCAREIDAPMYYDHHSICERLNLTPGKIEVLLDDLRSRGWRASRTHFCGVGIKTDAPLREVEAAMIGAGGGQNL
ncbi:MAG: tRNA (guanine(10)-N(2))-dimethyltransferase [Methanotrichaceae archaeon]|nr:tRNA (guanine(10)-N(2))-dimethyltransferase [Methanotrichaceae archaeon]